MSARVVVDDEAGRAQARCRGPQVLVGEGHVEVLGRGARGSRPPRTRPCNVRPGRARRSARAARRTGCRARPRGRPGRRDVADHGGDDRARRAGRAHRAEPRRAPWPGRGRPLASVSTLLTSGRVAVAAALTGRTRTPSPPATRGEQPVLPRRQQPGQRVAALDHLQHRLLLAEEVLVGSLDDRHGQVAEQPGLAEVDDGSPAEAGSPGRTIAWWPRRPRGRRPRTRRSRRPRRRGRGRGASACGP